MKYLIVGLGNIGSEYAGTRHNIGFTVLDALAEASNIAFKSERYGSVCEIRHKGRIAVLLKPSTYMNLSGNAVRYWMQKEKIDRQNVFVIVDDLALPFGTLRIRKKGSDGGHNGLKHINQVLGNADYARLRFGIGGDFPKGYQIDHVLGEWGAQEKKELPGYVDSAVKAIYDFMTIGIDRTMNIHNTKKAAELPAGSAGGVGSTGSTGGAGNAGGAGSAGEPKK